MVRNPFSSRKTGLSLEDMLEHANKYLSNARKESNTAKALEISNNAKSLMKDAEMIFASKKVSIANAYHEHGSLLDDLGYHDKAMESHKKAEEWGYVHPVSANRELTPNEDVVQVSQTLFDQNITPPIIKYDLPEVNARITSTPQLAYCLSLLHPSMVSEEELDQCERDWLQKRVVDPDEKERLQTMATDLVRSFIREELKKSGVVAEVVSLAAVLGKEDFRKLLQAFVDGINQSVLLDVHLLNGLAQLIRNATQGYIDTDDLVKILELLNARLKETHNQSTQHTYQLVFSISQVLDSMVDSQVEGLSREQLHEPLSDYFKGLQENSDPYLIYQAAYARQALLYIPDDETILQSMMRRTGKVVQGVSGLVSAVKALDLIGLIEGLQSVQQGLAGAEKTIGLVSDACSNIAVLAKNGQGLLGSLKEGFNFDHKSSWYPALRGLDRLIQEGRFADFERLAREASCQHNPAFRWGVSQRLGEIATNTIWDLNTRKCAVDFLIQLYKDDASTDQVNIKQWILYILNQLAKSSKDITDGSTEKFLQEAQANNGSAKETPHDGCGSGNPVLHPITATPPPMEFPLLDRVQNKPDIETPLRQLRQERLKDQGGDVYISPRAKATPRATDYFDLTTMVQEFLASDRKVFLLLGDSGAGKSTFNRALEISLWENFDKANGRIPLFIHLPAIEKPERDLIAERLRRANFTESQILELKLHRQFILICDGYDESQQTRNLYMSNNLNQPGEWRAQMVISCRTEYNGVDYKHRFEPTDRNGNGKVELFQQAIASPFNKDQIQAYVEQYVSLGKSSWEPEDYYQALKQIPNLQDLVKNPFLLKLALEVLPRLLNNDGNYSAARVTRIELYDEFVAQWIERGKKRLTEMELSSRDKLAFRQLSDSGFKELGIAYLKELVTAIYDNQNGNPVVSYSEHHDRTTWKEAFFSEKDGSHLLREAIPLARNGDQYRFVHKSLLEYGLSLAIFGLGKRNVGTEVAPSLSRRNSTSSTFSFECSASTERTNTSDEQSLADSPLGRRNLVGERSILQFLAERAQQEAIFKDQLHSVIEQSKSDETVRIAAANAITILVRAGVQFNGTDLRNIKIPGADLSFGVFDSARLEGADLRKVNFRNIWVRQANLRGAQMKGVQFGELPFLQEGYIVLCCEYSPNGDTYAAGLYNARGDQIASGSSDKTVRLWNVGTGECVLTLQGHSGYVYSVAYSPKGDRVASGSEDSTVRLWDVDTGKCIHTLQDHDGMVFSVAYSPKGDLIASGSDDSTVRLWDVDTGKCVHTLQDSDGAANGVVYSPKGDRIAYGSWDKTVRLWDVKTRECVRTLQGHSSCVASIAYSPKGDRIASGSKDSTVRLWDVNTGECIHTLKGHSNEVFKVAYSPKADRIASGSEDWTVRLWDVDTGECVHTLRGHSDRVCDVVYSPKGDHIVSGSCDKTSRLWDINTGECVHTLQGHGCVVNSVEFSPKGDQIASGSDDTVQLWDVDTGECIRTLQGHSWIVSSVAYSPKGDRIAYGSWDKTVRLWDVDTDENVQTLQGHSGRVRSVAYSPKGDRIASGSDDSTVRLWDVDTGECIRTLQGHGDVIFSVAYSPKGDRVASGSGDTTVRLWDVDTGKCVHIIQDHSYQVRCVVYSPKGDRVASGSEDLTVWLWDADTGKCVHALMGHNSSINSVVFSPGGDLVASGSSDLTVKLWDVEIGQCLATILVCSDGVSSIALKSSFGTQYLVTGSKDKSVRCWQVTKEESEYKVALRWSSSHEVLTVQDLYFEDVQDLSRLDRELLIQRGALIPKPLVVYEALD
ncbi:hypothetical protein BGZ80_009533 [Entomortierella chlamydospora]|uniref:Arm-like repeat domain-containing protein n=1 Tax=Entomortierella chlamydospora TaxID=101097 RepID=A0A9P6MXG1_9FUNG|nr:hypothetical protein BGZ80_009533 [Entomortierella chlamydospora]